MATIIAIIVKTKNESSPSRSTNRLYSICTSRSAWSRSLIAAASALPVKLSKDSMRVRTSSVWLPAEARSPLRSVISYLIPSYSPPSAF